MVTLRQHPMKKKKLFKLQHRQKKYGKKQKGIIINLECLELFGQED